MKKILTAVLAISLAVGLGSFAAGAQAAVATATATVSSAVVTDDVDYDAIIDPPANSSSVSSKASKASKTPKAVTKKTLFINYNLSDDGTLTISKRSKGRDFSVLYKQYNDWFANYGRVTGKKDQYGYQELIRVKTPWDSKASKIKKIVIKKGIQSIPAKVFVDLPNLKEITIESNKVGNTGEEAYTDAGYYIVGDTFVNCPKLTKINLPADMYWSIDNNAVVNCPKLKATLLTITYKYDKATKSLKIFPKKDENGEILSGTWYVFGIPWEAVKNDIKSVELAEGFKQTGDFKDMKSLTTVKLPASLERINSSSFANDAKLKNVVIPKNVTYIDSNAFSGTGFTLVHLKKPADGTDYNDEPTEGKLTVSSGAYSDCPNLKTVTVDAGVTINSGTFANNKKLTKVTLVSGAVMEGNAFYGCDALKTVKSEYMFSPSGGSTGDIVQASMYGSNGWGTYAQNRSSENPPIVLFTKNPANTKAVKLFGGKNIKWATTNKTVASVDSKGKIKGLQEGFTVVYAKSGSDRVSFLVEVYGEVSRRIMDVQKDLPDGYYWNTYPPADGYREVSSQPCTDHPTDSHGKGQCAGYGYLMARKVFGGARHIPLKSEKDVKVGTYVRMSRGWSWAHSVFVVQKIKEGQIIGYDFKNKKSVKAGVTIYVCTDCNWDRQCGIRWGFLYDTFNDINLGESFNCY